MALVAASLSPAWAAEASHHGLPVVLEGEAGQDREGEEGHGADDRDEQGQQHRATAGLGHADGEPPPEPAGLGGVARVDDHRLLGLGARRATTGARGRCLGRRGGNSLPRQASAAAATTVVRRPGSRWPSRSRFVEATGAGRAASSSLGLAGGGDGLRGAGRAGVDGPRPRRGSGASGAPGGCGPGGGAWPRPCQRPRRGLRGRRQTAAITVANLVNGHPGGPTGGRSAQGRPGQPRSAMASSRSWPGGRPAPGAVLRLRPRTTSSIRATQNSAGPSWPSMTIRSVSSPTTVGVVEGVGRLGRGARLRLVAEALQHRLGVGVEAGRDGHHEGARRPPVRRRGPRCR